MFKRGEITEVLIAPGQQWGESVSWSVVKAICMMVCVLSIGFSFIHYENKIGRLEMRLQILETETILRTEKIQAQVVRVKRDASPTYDGDRYPSSSINTRSFSRSQSSSSPPRSRVAEVPLDRNDQDETFFTRGRDGRYVRPQGLQEIYERLPQETPTTVYQSPPIDYSQVQTRSSDRRGERVNPPVQRVGHGADQVSARVVRFDDKDDFSSAPNTLVSQSPVAAHFVADVSNFTSTENPRLRNANGIFQIWRPSTWMRGDNNFQLDSKEGYLTVQKPGLYYIYAQIHYHDEQPNSFLVEVNGSKMLQCSTQQGTNSCFTAGLNSLRRGDRIVIKNIGADRFSIYTPEKSFFGLMKLDN